MLIVIGLISVLVAVPVAINVMAVAQTTTSQEAAVVIQAKQAAAAGVSDYINHLQAYNGAHSGSSYTAFCSSGVSSLGCAGLTDTTNPAFVSSTTSTGGWYSNGVTMPASVNGGASYRYVVSAPDASNTHITVFSIGQAGTQHGQHATFTDEAALTVGGGLAPSSAATCVKVPTNAVSATIVAYGAKGGAGSPYSGTAAAGGSGALITATVPVTANDILDLIPGQPGKIGNFHLLDLINLFPGAGGYGGSQAVSCSLLPAPPHTPADLSGGNGDIPGGIVDLSTNGGGGGGGASAVYDATADSMVTVAGGGGGGGGPGNILGINALGLVGLNFPPTAGGTAGNPPGAGAAVSTVNILLLISLPGAVGGLAGTWASGGATTCERGTAGKACGQYGIAAPTAGVANGGGGGGGGGYSAAGVGGGGGGATGALGACLSLFGVHILCTGALAGVAGSGAGGGAGSSYPTTSSCGASTFGTPAQYAAGDPTGVGMVGITFYGGACGATPLTTVTGTIRAASPPT
ncbi:MAG TPA: hypothetical protein VGG43_10645 [Acidimicrobiales bacterium]|jgi:hypothetical protein